MNTDTEMDIYRITAERIAAAARTAYPDRKIKVVHVRRELVVSIVHISTGHSVLLDHEGVRWEMNGTDMNYVSWDGPHFEGLVAAGISELVGEPFPADWMEAGL